jgi:hypothetical protein
LAAIVRKIFFDVLKIEKNEACAVLLLSEQGVEGCDASKDECSM